MSNFLFDRLECLRAVVSKSEEVKHLKLLDGISAVFKWYGLNRRKINRQLKVVPVDNEIIWIELGEYGIAWPRNQSLHRLVGALVELWAPSNSHYYFSGLTEVKAGDYVIDVGATEGSFAIECLTRYKAARVWCFEPDLSMRNVLKMTAERNHLAENLHIVPSAVAGITGQIRFFEDAIDPLASRRVDVALAMENRTHQGLVRTVPSVSLDDWAHQAGVERIDYIKIDAEGSDLDALMGARSCLERWHPAIAVTTYHHPNHCNEMVEYLNSLDLGYRFDVKGLISFDSVPRPVMLHAATWGRTGR